MKWYKIIETFIVRAKNKDEALKKHNRQESKPDNVEVEEV